MKNLTCAILLTTVAAGLAGCGLGFPDEEMHLGLQDKVRPFAVLVEPPEAAPGQTVQVTLLGRASRPDQLDISWRVALDYSQGLYEVDEIERNFRALAAPPAAADEDGFLTQTFSWTVPDSVLQQTSALPEVLDDPVLTALLAGMPGFVADTPPTRAQVAAWLADLTPEGVAALASGEREAVWALADRFACQVRLRATLRTDEVVEVTRNLTVRHTARLGGPNANLNTRVRDFAVVAMEKRDATESDIDDTAVPRTWYRFVDGDGIRVADQVQIPVHEGWTYYLTAGFEAQSYDAPFEPGLVVQEEGDFRWYYYRQDAPSAEHQFFVTEDGQEAEMWDLDEHARIDPAGPGSRFRVVVAVRDTRGDWAQYQAAPGTGVAEGVVEFVGR